MPVSNIVELDTTAQRERALVELEQRLLGWQLAGAPGVIETAAQELRCEAGSFQPPYNWVQDALFRAFDQKRAVTPSSINADLHDCIGLTELGGHEHLQAMAYASPAVISREDGERHARESIRAWKHLHQLQPKVGDVELVTADTVKLVKIDWIWRDWLAAGKFHVLAGSPGSGKTTLALAIAAAITSGGLFPCGTRAERGSALFWTGEDDWADSIVPRFVANGGDTSRLHFVEGIRGENGEIQPFDPAFDIERLINRARQIKGLKLLIMDPVVSVVTGDSHKNTETRRSLQPLVDFAAKAGIAVLGITHCSKGAAGRDPAERVIGSLAFTAVPRVVMLAAKHHQPGEPRRLVRAKSNIGPDGGGFEYDLQRVSIGGSDGVQGQCVIWGEVLEGSAWSLLAEAEAQVETAKAPALESAKAWLPQYLGNGRAAATAVRDAADQMGHAWATVKRAAKELGVEKVKVGLEGGWAWQMPKMLKAA